MIRPWSPIISSPKGKASIGKFDELPAGGKGRVTARQGAQDTAANPLACLQAGVGGIADAALLAHSPAGRAQFSVYEEFSIKAVSNACGFSYPAVFSRDFKAQFAQTPREFRARLRKDQNMAIRPAIRRLILRQL